MVQIKQTEKSVISSLACASGGVETARLTEISRRRGAVVVNARRVNRGEFPVAKPPQDRKADFYFIKERSPSIHLGVNSPVSRLF